MQTNGSVVKRVWNLLVCLAPAKVRLKHPNRRALSEGIVNSNRICFGDWRRLQLASPTDTISRKASSEPRISIRHSANLLRKCQSRRPEIITFPRHKRYLV